MAYPPKTPSDVINVDKVAEEKSQEVIVIDGSPKKPTFRAQAEELRNEQEQNRGGKKNANLITVGRKPPSDVVHSKNAGTARQWAFLLHEPDEILSPICVQKAKARFDSLAAMRGERSQQGQSNVLITDEVRLVKVTMAKTKPLELKNLFRVPLRLKRKKTTESEDVISIQTTVMEPSFDVRIELFEKSAVLSDIPDSKTIEDHSVTAVERKREREHSLEEESILEAPRGKWEPCSVIFRTPTGLEASNRKNLVRSGSYRTR